MPPLWQPGGAQASPRGAQVPCTLRPRGADVPLRPIPARALPQLGVLDMYSTGTYRDDVYLLAPKRYTKAGLCTFWPRKGTRGPGAYPQLDSGLRVPA